MAVHLRRGDYCKPENAILQVCTPAYYARATAAAAAAHPEATLFVFSDDPDWAKKNLDTAGLPAVFMPRGEAVADMNLMALCRGFVLSNSTYSWWAQYLAGAGRTVWAPDRWYAPHQRDSPLPAPLAAHPNPITRERRQTVPFFSIIVPVYNVQNYLSACIKSVAEQDGPRDWECILVDDGSTDMGPQLCDTFAAEIPGVRVIHRENGGLAAARNTGLGAARGEWILFLDSDDAMAPGLLAALRRALREHPGYDWYVGKHLEWQPDGTLTEHAGLRLLPGPFDSSDYGERLRGALHRGALVGVEVLPAPGLAGRA